MEPGEKTHQELRKSRSRLPAAGDGRPDEDTRRDIQQLRDRIEALRKDMSISRYKAWDKRSWRDIPSVLSLDYIERIFTDWSEIHGDRGYADDPPLSAAWPVSGEEVMIVGHQKARDTKQKVYRNWHAQSRGISQGHAGDEDCGEVWPPALYLRGHARRYPGLGAEERGQAEAIGTICARWRGCRFPSLPRSQAKAAAAERSPSPSPTAF